MTPGSQGAVVPWVSQFLPEKHEYFIIFHPNPDTCERQGSTINDAGATGMLGGCPGQPSMWFARRPAMVETPPLGTPAADCVRVDYGKVELTLHRYIMDES